MAQAPNLTQITLPIPPASVPLHLIFSSLKRWPNLFFLLLLVSLLLRVACMIWTPLIPEEAYYWMYAQHPSLSYYDHPPMIAWTIKLGTLIFGDTELGVRSVGAILMLISSLLIYQFGRMWFGHRAGLWSAVALQVLPVYYGAGYIATMDSALIFYWMLCLVGVSFALQRNSPWGWYCAGLALGAAALTKYTAVFLGAGALLAVVAYRPWWRHLRTPHPYLAAAIAAAAFMPVVIWNAQNNWVSFRFQLADRFKDSAFSITKPLLFAAIQLLILTPVLLGIIWLIVIRLANRPKRLIEPRWIVAFAFSIPLLAVALQKSFTYEIHINWTLPAYLSIIPAIMQGAILLRRSNLPRLFPKLLAASVPVTGLLCTMSVIGILAYLLILQPHTLWIGAFGPWRQLAAVVEDAENRLQAETQKEPLVIGDGKYRTASVVAFYRNPLESDGSASENTTSQWVANGRNGLGFEYWMDLDKARGRDCVVVAQSQEELDKLTGNFKSVEAVEDVRLAFCAPYRVAIARDLQR